MRRRRKPRRCSARYGSDARVTQWAASVGRVAALHAQLRSFGARLDEQGVRGLGLVEKCAMRRNALHIACARWLSLW